MPGKNEIWFCLKCGKYIQCLKYRRTNQVDMLQIASNSFSQDVLCSQSATLLGNPMLLSPEMSLKKS